MRSTKKCFAQRREQPTIEATRRFYQSCGMLTCASTVLVCISSCTTDRSATTSYVRFWHSLVALENYHSMHGEFPVDERGTDYALYHLRQLAAPDSFSRTGESRWDHENGRVLNAEYLYANLKLSDLTEPVVLLVGPDTTNEGFAFVGFSNGRVRHRAVSDDDGGELLGRTESELWPD